MFIARCEKSICEFLEIERKWERIYEEKALKLGGRNEESKAQRRRRDLLASESSFAMLPTARTATEERCL